MQKTIHRFTPVDDMIILKYFKKFPNDKSMAILKIQQEIGEQHKKKSIEERYRCFLSKNMEPFSPDEDVLILQYHTLYQNAWAQIAKRLATNRSGDQVKIRFSQLTRKRKNKTVPLPKNPPEIFDMSYLEIANLMNPR